MPPKQDEALSYSGRGNAVAADQADDEDVDTLSARTGTSNSATSNSVQRTPIARLQEAGTIATDDGAEAADAASQSTANDSSGVASAPSDSDSATAGTTFRNQHDRSSQPPLTRRPVSATSTSTAEGGDNTSVITKAAVAMATEVSSAPPPPLPPSSTPSASSSSSSSTIATNDGVAMHSALMNNNETGNHLSDLDRDTARSIRLSISSRPGAYYCYPLHRTNSNEGDPEEQISHDSAGTATSMSPGVTRQVPSAPLEHELAEAWVVEESAASAMDSAPPADADADADADATEISADSSTSLDVEPAIVTVTATPVKERRWFMMPSGIFWILIVGGIVALAVAIPMSNRRKRQSSEEMNAAAASRPFEIVVPNMPKAVSGMLEAKYDKVIEGRPIVMAFSSDLTVHAATLVDAYYGQLQVVKYNATSTSWEVMAKYDQEEAREQDLKEEHVGNSAGDNFGAWADMSYDGSILAVGLPRDDPNHIPDAGSVRVIKILAEGGENNETAQRWKLEGHGNFIAGTDPFGWTGATFSLSADGSVIAVASPIASKGRGSICVYKFEEEEMNSNGGEWTQIGQQITGDEFGSALSMTKLSEDGTMLATGSFQHGRGSGQLRMFQWDAATNLWVQLGSTIEGRDKARLGAFPHFSMDGLTMAFSQVGDPLKCHIYQWQESNSDWNRIDNGIPNGFICLDLSPDGQKLILCSKDENRCALHTFDGGEWVEAQDFNHEHGFLPYLFERDGEGDKVAGIVAPRGSEEDYTIGFYNII